MSKKLWGIAVLKLLFVAKNENIDGIDLCERLELFIDSQSLKGVQWATQRGYIKNKTISRRGIRFIKKEMDDGEYDESKKIMLDIINEER
jgi:hypothetical protein